MAVAVKDTTGTASRRPLDPLIMGSLVGALFVIGSIGVIFYGLPNLWNTAIAPWLSQGLGSFFNQGLLLLAQVGVAVGLVVLGLRVLGSDPPHGLRAGIFFSAAGLFAIGLLTWGVGRLLEYWHRIGWFNVGEATPWVGLAVTGVVGVGLLVGGFFLLVHPNTAPWLRQVEDQGWFSRAPYKKNQGVRVRRGTILGILAITGSGIWVLITRNTLSFGPPNNWELVLPFSGGRTLTLLTEVRFTVPIILSLAALWFAFRVVNYPVFADFLIATEAELNKVSWTTRRRLVQDTIVVLTTVILLTLFLFFVDIAWYYVLSSKWVGVLQFDATKVEKQLTDQDTKW